MSEDRSLDDFASAETDEDASADGDDPTEDDSDEHGLADVEPAESTSTWSADGADCDRCGATVERRWRDGDGLVCADCAEW
ncbi:DUF7573 domain-containing protein [Halorubrum cibi]|uniref:DUF7573 domain-containing protein n=1 Tax=Halorubrum cibi TaxID=413815 RepID=A0A521DZL4_9EURY|nr:hypothetical protein [Halorubrum cibi]SMO77062.1 hypothetical protein SAMN06264867_108174 [Halorubrum cibi]